MPVYSPVRADLRQILLTTPGVPTVAWEGRAFTPVPGIRWIDEKLSPVANRTATMGYGGYSRLWLAYTLLLYSPPVSASMSEDEDLIDAIMFQYPVGREVGGVNVFGRVWGNSRSGTKTDASWRTTSLGINLWVMPPLVGDPAVT